MITTYTTVQDVRANSGIARIASECSIVSIPITERYLFKTTLLPLRDVLKENRINYTDVENWDKTKQYVEGDVVKYDGAYKVALKDSTGEAPSKYSFWENAPMFSKECLNELWCRDILPYISHMVVHNDQPILMEAMSKSSGSGRDYISAKSIEQLAQQSLISANMAYDNLMLELKENDCFGVKIESDCKTCEEKLAEKEHITTGHSNRLGGSKFY